MTKPVLAIASGHERHDALEREVALALPDFEIVRVRTPEQLATLAAGAAAPRFVFFPHWSWKIPASIYQHFECVMFHMTDLPFGRGGSPLQNLIVRGYTDTVLTAFRCEAGMDTGPVYDKRPLSLAGSAEDILGRAAHLMVDMIARIARTHPEPRAQVGEATAFVRRRPEEGNLAACSSLRQVHDFIRMLDADGYPNAFLEVGDLRLEFAGSQPGEGFVDARVRFRMRGNG